MKIQLLLCAVLALALSQPVNLPAAESEKSTGETAAEPASAQLGELQVQVRSIKKKGQSVNAKLTFTNTGKETLYVLAGTPQEDATGWTIQKFAGSASDDLGNKYTMLAVQGFQNEPSYFTGANQFMELAPDKSGDAIFTLKGPPGAAGKDPTKVDLNLPLITLRDLNAKGSHQAQPLILKEQSLD